eukprot:GHVP01023908.1.p1 GENE.GHVP01023908.1~~GHVP01023908.1.p1  ORF type:complete len:101 (+),score=9.11 GHVP01023908.1:179-481(+)
MTLLNTSSIQIKPKYEDLSRNIKFRSKAKFWKYGRSRFNLQSAFKLMKQHYISLANLCRDLKRKKTVSHKEMEIVTIVCYPHLDQLLPKVTDNDRYYAVA